MKEEKTIKEFNKIYLEQQFKIVIIYQNQSKIRNVFLDLNQINGVQFTGEFLAKVNARMSSSFGLHSCHLT